MAALLPPPTGHGPAVPCFVVPEPLPPLALPALPDLGGAPDAVPLRRRLLQVRAQAARLRLELHQASKGSALQQRREWGLALLQDALPPAEVTTAAEQAHLSRWPCCAWRPLKPKPRPSRRCWPVRCRPRRPGSSRAGGYWG